LASARASVSKRSAGASGPPTRRALTFLDPTGERTITTLGQRLSAERSDRLGWEELADFDAVYFTAGDAGTLRAARAARVLVASPRGRGAFADGGEPLDALVLSARDAPERGWAAELDPSPRITVMTAGAGGGSWTDGDGSAGSWQAAPAPGPFADSYGCGDAFAAGLTYALGRGDRLELALELAAGCGAACLTRRGPYGDPALRQT
jgi:ribokinase